jgi:hypothetical protein
MRIAASEGKSKFFDFPIVFMLSVFGGQVNVGVS